MGQICVPSAAAVVNPAASSWLMPWYCCAGSALEASMCLWCRLLSGYLLSHSCGVDLFFSCCVLLITAMLSYEMKSETNAVCQVNLPGDSCVTGLCACVSPLLQACFHLPDLVCLSFALGIAIAVYKQICQAVLWYVTLSKYCTCQLAANI